MKRPLRRLLIALPLIALAALTLTCSPGYVLRAGWQEAKILSRRRPIERVIDDPATSDEVRRKLRLVLPEKDVESGAGVS